MKIKSILGALFVSAFMGISALAQDVQIKKEELPANAKNFIGKHFSGVNVNSTWKDIDDAQIEYKVHLANGIEIEFDQNGDWTEVDGNKRVSVPNSVIHSKVVSYVSKNYPKATITKVERNAQKIEVDLSTGVDLDFDTNGNFIKVD